MAKARDEIIVNFSQLNLTKALNDDGIHVRIEIRVNNTI